MPRFYRSDAFDRAYERDLEREGPRRRQAIPLHINGALRQRFGTAASVSPSSDVAVPNPPAAGSDKAATSSAPTGLDSRHCEGSIPYGATSPRFGHIDGECSCSRCAPFDRVDWSKSYERELNRQPIEIDQVWRPSDKEQP